jgi:exodeoxyribonuclease-3
VSLFPNGNPWQSEIEYKLNWLKRLTAHAKKLLSQKVPVALIGDFNVMPTEMDVYKPERWVNDALFRIEIRDAYKKLASKAGQMH